MLNASGNIIKITYVNKNDNKYLDSDYDNVERLYNYVETGDGTVVLLLVVGAATSGVTSGSSVSASLSCS